MQVLRSPFFIAPIVVLVVLSLLGWYWSQEPAYVTHSNNEVVESDVVGVATAQMLISTCLLYTSPSPRDQRGSRMPSSA